MTSVLEQELDANQSAFFANWTAQAVRNWSTLKQESPFRLSYRRLSCLQTLKNEIIVPHYSSESAAFFFEAHNDALASHVAASFGAWRLSLNALRSCIENFLCTIYYTDHPIELQLWARGEFRIGFSRLMDYLRSHPRIASLPPPLTGLDTLKHEYALLSQAVHGSAKNIRMTDAVAAVLLWNTDRARLGMWSTHEKRTLEALSQLLICLHPELLEGTRLPAVRAMLYFAIRPAKRAAIQAAFHISIPAPQ